MTSMDKIFADYESRLKTLNSSPSNPYNSGLAYISGQFFPLSEATIPILDQGFLKGDLTYDVPGVWSGRFFRLDEHLSRLQASCSKLRLKLPLPLSEIRELAIKCVAKSGIRDAYVEFIVTRGLKGVRGTKTVGEAMEGNRFYLLVMPYIWVLRPEVQRVGGSAVVARTVRRTSPGSMDPTAKNLQWGDLTRGMFEAMERGADQPFLTDGEGNLTEGSGFNIVLVKDGVLYTPVRGVLEGITRKSVIDAARINGLDVRIDYIPVEMVYQADEIFTCTTAGGIMPITKLDGQPIRDGKIGPITTKIWDTYWEMHWDPKYSLAISYEDEARTAKL